jgi:hypothetical protein
MSKRHRRFWVYRGCESCPCKQVDKTECFRPREFVMVKFLQDQYEKIDGELRQTFKKGEVVDGRAVIVGRICYCLECNSTLIPGLKVKVSLNNIKIRKYDTGQIWTDNTHSGTGYFF